VEEEGFDLDLMVALLVTTTGFNVAFVGKRSS
jgi:hypothetical protein